MNITIVQYFVPTTSIPPLCSFRQTTSLFQREELKLCSKTNFVLNTNISHLNTNISVFNTLCQQHQSLRFALSGKPPPFSKGRSLNCAQKLTSYFVLSTNISHLNTQY